MAKSKFPAHIQEILDEKKVEWNVYRRTFIKQMDNDGFTGDQIAWVFGISKGRVSQILKEK